MSVPTDVDTETMEELVAISSLQESFRQRMADLCMTKAQLARRLGVTAGRVTKILEKPSNLTLGVCVRVARQLESKVQIEVVPLEKG